MTPKEFFKIARRVKWVVVNDVVRTKSFLSRSEEEVKGGASKTHRLCPLAYVTKHVNGIALWASLDSASLHRALSDPEPNIRRHAVRLAANRLKKPLSYKKIILQRNAMRATM